MSEQQVKIIARGFMNNNKVRYAVFENDWIFLESRSGIFNFSLLDFGNNVNIISKDHYYSVRLKGPIVELGYGCFSDWYNLKRVVLPKSVSVIGERSFSDCDNLYSILMPGNVTLGTGLFVYSGLRQVEFYNDIIINDDVRKYFESRGTKIIIK